MSPLLNIYLDTSVINHLFADDAPERKRNTIEFFEQYIKQGVYNTYVSNIVVAEINKTPDNDKRDKLLNVLKVYPILYADITNIDEITRLADLYIANKIIPQKKREDALHIAITVVNQFEYLVSWNFQHLANVNRERRVLSINYQNNYFHPLRIIPPLQLMGTEL